MSKLRVGSLFAGIGGMELGLERTGHYETVWQVEIHDLARRVLERHWPDVKRHDDVCTFPTQDHDWSCDVLTGGFPCQDLSVAGKGEGLSGSRSGLFYEVVRIISCLGPRYVILENVSALLARGMGDVLGELAKVGYNAEWHCITAAYTGAPHERDRLFILAYRDMPRHGTQGHEAGQHWKEESGQKRKDVLFELGGLRAAKGAGRKHWESEPAVGRVVDGLPRRMDRLRLLGNSIVPQVAEVVGNRLYEIHRSLA